MVAHYAKDEETVTSGAHKKHRAKQSGPKSEKKQAKSKGQTQHNVKAFAVQHTTKAARLVQRTLDYQTRKHHVPQLEHVVDASPPIIVALVGPPKSGKTTLLKSLIKHFAHQAIGVVQGPLTVVVGKKLRLTFIECGCDINSMLDAAKIADVVLLMVNVRLGLEMYHFEFINILQVHGLPRVIPVLNHLDTFKDSSSSRASRRKIKQRLWVDLNSKIFLLTKFLPKKYQTAEALTDQYSKPGDYLLAEVRRLARMIVVKVPRPTDWRTAHPYLLVDRLEDITDSSVLSNSPTADRCVSMYGWIRGAPLPPALTSPGIHIAGLGDFTVANCTRQPDPCPLPCQMTEGMEKSSRHLAERERKIYAPMSSLGGVLFDRDATYIDLGGSHYLTNHSQRGSKREPKVATQAALDEVHSMFATTCGLDEQLESGHKVRILNDASYLRADTFEPSPITMEQEDTESGTTISDGESEQEEQCQLLSDKLVAGFLVPAGEDLPKEPDNQSTSKKSENSRSLHQTVKNVLDDIEWQPTSSSRPNWNRVIYGSGQDSSRGPETSSSGLIAGLFQLTEDNTLGQSIHDFTWPSATHMPSTSVDWSSSDNLELVINRFTTGKWDSTEDAQSCLQSDTQVRAQLALEQARKFEAAQSAHVNYKPNNEEFHDSDEDVEALESSSTVDDDEDEFSDESGSDVGEDKLHNANEDPDVTDEYEKRLLIPTKRQKLLEKRKRHKALFEKLYEAAAGGPEATAFYDKLVAAKEAQLAANKAILEKLPGEIAERLEGFPPGAYVRLELRGIPHQFMQRFNPCQPLVAGGLPSAEESMGHLQVRMRTHRWLKRVLRSNDPITVSIGWRRYQTVAIYSKEEHNFRNRYLKYSLPHEHCLMTMYGPLVPAKTGVVLFMNSAWHPNSDDPELPSFRVAGTGSVLSTDQSFQIMKKLKLVGEPFKIFAKTAFIRGMFNSALEVSKMIGARVQTVSNVRGLIKAALNNSSVAQPGDFRATFEAQISKSDLVFLRTFAAVPLPKYYNPVLNRLCPVGGHGESGQQWRLMRTLTELRREAGAVKEFNADSIYKPIHRPVFVPAPLQLPTKLVSALPFAIKPKPSRKQAQQMLGGDPVQLALTNDLPPPIKPASLGDSDTRQELLTRLRQLHADFKRRQKEKMVTRVLNHKKQLSKAEQRRAQSERQRKKKFFARQRGKTNPGGTHGA